MEEGKEYDAIWSRRGVQREGRSNSFNGKCTRMQGITQCRGVSGDGREIGLGYTVGCSLMT